MDSVLPVGWKVRQPKWEQQRTVHSQYNNSQYTFSPCLLTCLYSKAEVAELVLEDNLCLKMSSLLHTCAVHAQCRTHSISALNSG